MQNKVNAVTINFDAKSINVASSIKISGRLGTSYDPIETLTVGDGVTLSLEGSAYVRSVVLGEGASIVPSEAVHIIGDIEDAML